MADKKIVRTLATNLTLDTDNAKAGLKELTGAVKDASNSAKILEAQYKSSGDEVSASKAKYEGLSQVVEAQKTKVDALKHSLEVNNTSTEAGRRNQEFLTAELAKAERQYQSYSGQLEKASQAYKYQESGLADLNKELKHSNEMTKANAEALDAQGKHEEANKVRLEGLKTAQANYSKQLAIQKDELKALADAGDKGSDAYKRQELRVAQIGAKLSATTRDIKDFNKTEIKPNVSGIDKVKGQLESLNASLEGTRSHLKSVFLGNLMANGVTSALENIKEKLSETLEGAKEYNKEQQVMQATWLTLTGDANAGKEMVTSINQISTAFGQSNDVVNELSQQFYHVFNQKGPTEELTKSMLTLADTLGMNAEGVERLGLNFTHMMSSTKLQLGDFNMITDQLPMYGEQLLEYEQKVQKNSKLTMAQLRDQMSAGKISAKDATEVMNELGDKYKTASENMMNTASGMERVIQARGKALAGALIAPIMNAQNPIFGAISKWVSDPKTEQEFNKVGDSISKAFGTITSAFGKEFKSSDFTGGADKLLDKLSDSITKFGDYVAKHKDDIIGFFKGIKALGDSGFGIMGSSLKIALPLLEDLGKFAQKNPETFKILAESILGVNFALKGTLGLMNGLSNAKRALGFLTGLVIKPKVDGSDAKRELGILGKLGKSLGKSLWWSAKLVATTVWKTLALIGDAVILTGKAFKWTGSLAITGVKKGLSALTTAGKATGTALKKGLSVTASVATKGAQVALKALAVTGKATGLALKGAFTFLKANPLGLLITGIALAITALVELYKHNKKFRDFINGIIKSAVDMAKGISQWFGDMWKTVSNIFGKIGDFIGDTLGWIKKTWDKYWQSISDFFGGIWKTLSSVGSSAIKGISSTIGDVLGGISSTWRSVWQGLSDFFGGIWRSIKGFAQDGVNGVLGIVNSLIDSLDSVWKFFTGHETSIHHLKPVKFEQGGIVTQRLAMVNDGQGQNWKELIQTPDGQLMMSQKRNAVMPLPVGTRVYNGDETKAIMNSFGIEKYANGGIVGGAINWAKGALSDVGSWIGDKFDAIGKFLDNPISAVKGLIDKATKHLIAPLGNFGQLATGMLDKLLSPISDWFTKGLKKVQEENQDGGGGRGAPTGAGVERWRPQVIDALRANGLSTSADMVARVLRQIQTESGGNEKAIQGNIGDINNRTGNLARGLMQVIPPTFNANKFPGHNDPYNGYDSLLAGLNYAKKTYGPSLSFLGNGHGYANGGLITKHQIAEIGEGNKPEMIIPLDGMKSSRGFELLGKTAVAMASRDGLTGQGMADSQEVTQLLNQNNQLLGVVTQLLGAILGETEKGNQPVDPLALNTLSRTLLNRTVRSTN